MDLKITANTSVMNYPSNYLSWILIFNLLRSKQISIGNLKQKFSVQLGTQSPEWDFSMTAVWENGFNSFDSGQLFDAWSPKKYTTICTSLVMIE